MYFPKISRRNLIIAGAVAVVAVAGFVVGFSGEDKVKEIDTNLTQEEVSEVQKDLGVIENRLAKLPDDESSNSTKVGLLVKKGIALHKLGKLEEARKVLEQALEIDASRADAWKALSEVQRDMRDYEAAEKGARTAVFLDPDGAEYWVSYAELYRDYLNKPTRETDQLYTQALFETGFHPQVIISYSVFLERQGNYQAAANYYKQLLGKFPDKEEYIQEVERLEELARQNTPEFK